jgi:hypothetical protein
MSIVQLTQPPDSPPTADLLPSVASLQIWIDQAREAEDRRGLIALTLPKFVIRLDQARLSTGRIDLADFGCAHRVTAIAFSPGDGCSSVTLIDSLGYSPEDRVTELEIGGHRFVDLYTIGWAARTAAVIFNR